MEENRKGPGVFYAVVGVATLVVAIIGATFAYFSASATATGDEITGGTNDDLASALSVTVDRVVYTDTTAASLDLVPAVMDDTTAAGVSGALAAKCENAGYTGCHVYKITATSSQTVANASVLLDLSTDAAVKTNWKYLVYTGTEDSATAISTAATSLATNAVGVDLHNNASMTAATPVVYYLMVYLANTETSQNDASSEIGTYTGAVTMNAAGGQVKATFTAQG